MAAIPGILILFILVAAVVYGTNRMVKEDTTQYDLQFLWDRYPIKIEQIEKKG